MTDVLLRRRPAWALCLIAAAIAATYVALTFDRDFLAGVGFWENPAGPWLLESTDTQVNGDMMALLAGYAAYVHAPWQFPPFLIPSFGPPPGTSGIFLDFIPIVALAGKLASLATGALVNPYGAWMGGTFLLAAVFATLVLVEAGEAHVLGCLVASLFAISAPPLLHRFGHVVLFGQFVVIAALWLYLRDRRTVAWRAVAARWALLLCLTALINIYLFVMVGAIYAASWLDRRILAPTNPAARWGEPACIAAAVAVLLLAAGHIGQGTTSPFSGGYGHWSMNLAAPFWPQRSGLFLGKWPIIDGTGGQYEGFNYLGAGGLFLLAAALLRDGGQVVRLARAHPGFAAMAIGCTVFAVSDRVYLFNMLLLDYRIAWRIDYVLGTFRSSGRFFWPVYYAILLAAAVLALRHRRPAMLIVPLLACALQLADTEPLRARLATLSRQHSPMLIARNDWEPRLDRAAALVLSPTYNCAAPPTRRLSTEFNFLASRRNRPTNSVYNPRARADCEAETTAMVHGPWPDDALYVLFTAVAGSVPAGFAPPGLHCEPFAYGIWCLGRATGN
jgi:hypothetical protein